MKILALETSTLLGGVALLEGENILSERSSLRQKSHSEVINSFVQEILTEQKLSLNEIDYFAVGIGPGSFTGIRTGLNIGKTFSYCHKKPMVGVDSLSNLAYGASLKIKDQSKTLKILTIINAFKNMVYIALFENVSEGNINAIIEPGVIHVNQLFTFLESQNLKDQVVVVGDGFKAYEKYFSKEIFKSLKRYEDLALDYPTASGLGQLAYKKIKTNETKDWNFILPLYIRASEAEENKKGIVFIPLDER